MTGHANRTEVSPRTVSLIIPVYNGGTAFIHCLRALLKSRSQPDEIIVAANGCQDRSVEIARLHGAMIFEIPQAIGPAAARNIAARQARSDLLFFVDADVAVHPDAMDTMRACFQKNPNIAACFGSYDDSPPETNFISQYKNLFHHFIHQQSDSQSTTFWAGCGAVRRTVFEEMGGFDETYRKPAIEDIELGYRMTARGHQIRLEKHLLATHLKRWSLASMLKADIFGRAIPWASLILRSRSMPDDLNTKKHHRISVLLVALLTCSLIIGLFAGIPIWPAVFGALLLIILNKDWYWFALQRKGWYWTLPAIACHWTYYLYCGAAFAYVVIRQLTSSQIKTDR